MRDGCLVQNVIDACLFRGTLRYVLYVCDSRHKLSKKQPVEYAHSQQYSWSFGLYIHTWDVC